MPTLDASAESRPPQRRPSIFLITHPALIPMLTGGMMAMLLGSGLVLLNLGRLPAPASTLVVVAWIVVVLWWTWATYIRVRVVPPDPGTPEFDAIAPRRRAGRLYGLIFVAMVAALIVDATVIRAAAPRLQVGAAVAIIGLHFVGHGWAYRARIFLVAGVATALVGVAALVVELSAGTGADALCALVAGAILLAAGCVASRHEVTGSRRAAAEVTADGAVGEPR